MSAMSSSTTILLGLILLHSTMAFVPDENYGQFTFSNSKFHSVMTQNALNKVFVNYLGGSTRCKGNITADMSPEQMFDICFGAGSSPVKFQQAKADVVAGNANTDKDAATKNDPLYHFDDEKLLETNELIWTRMRDFWSILTLDSSNDCSQARRLLGQIIHTLQDFYSHTNWVELGNQDINREVAADTLERIRALGPLAGRTEPTCKDCADPGPFAPFICENNTVTHKLTSGYYLALAEAASFWEDNKSPKPKNVSKCSHGGTIDATTKTPPIGGINKDSTNKFLSPHHYLHVQAADMAEKATEYFFRQLLNRADDQILGCFFGLDESALAFVIDTTVSTRAYVRAAVQRAKMIVESMENSYDAPLYYVLVPFDDRTYGPANTSSDPDQFQQSLDSLPLSVVNGDAPEMCYHAIYLAQQNVMRGSQIFVFADSSPKDAYMHDLLLAVAQDKQLSINFLLGGVTTGANGTSKPDEPRKFDDYYKLAIETGGIVIRSTGDQDDIVNSTAVFQLLLNAATVLIYRIDNQTGPLALTAIPVDTTMSSLILVVTTDQPACVKSLDLVDPNGKRIDTAQSRLSQTTFLIVANGTNLPVGMWSFNLSTSCPSCCRYSVLVLGQSTSALFYSLTEFQSDSPHQSFQPIDGNPLRGSSLLLVMDGGSPNMNFTHIDILNSDKKNAVGSTFPIDYSTGGDYHYFSNITIPDYSFRIQAHGVDALGNQLIRQSVGTINPSNLSLSANPVGSDTSTTGSRGIVQGQSLRVNVTITNYGPQGQFNLSAEDTKGFAEIHAQTFTIKEGGTAIASISLRAPATARPGTVSNLHVIVSPINGTGGNSVHLSINVVPKEEDTTPPACTILNSTFKEKCQNLSTQTCASVQWNAELVFSDRGLGLYRTLIESVGGKVEATVEKFQKYLADKNVSAKLLGDCCVQNVSFQVVDVLGQSAECLIGGAPDGRTGPSVTATATPGLPTKQPQFVQTNNGPRPILRERDSSASVAIWNMYLLTVSFIIGFMYY